MILALDPAFVEVVVALLVLDLSLLIAAAIVVVLAVGAWWWARAISAVASARANLFEADAVARAQLASGLPTDEETEADRSREAGRESVTYTPLAYEDEELIRGVRASAARRAAAGREADVRTTDEADGYEPKEPPVPGTRSFAETRS